MKTLEFIEKIIEEKSTRIIEANDQIWEFAELAYHEYQSAGLLCQFLKDEGFTVETGLAGIPTCFQGTYSYGCGKPVVGILGEYDLSSREHLATDADTVPWVPELWQPPLPSRNI